MTGIEWLGVLTQALLKGAVTQIAKKGVDGVFEWAREEANRRNVAFTASDRDQLEKLLREAPLRDTLISQFLPVAQRGLAIVGPSGVGKTSLYNYLVGKSSLTPAYSTPERSAGRTRIGRRRVAVVDTPGSFVQVNLARETYEYIRGGKPSILLIMLAYGYLDTIGVPGLRRPGFASREESSVQDYLAKARDEELDWLRDLLQDEGNVKGKIPYCMIVVNKADQWSAQTDMVLDYYRAGKASKHIQAVVNKFCRTGTQPSFHVAATTYNSFKGTAPVAEWSAESAQLSLAILRAEIRYRWNEL